MKNNKFSTTDVKRVCESKADINFRKAKEFNGWVELNNKKIARITIPKGRKPIPKKTYKTMAGQLKLTVSQFDDFLECPLSKKDYFGIVSGSN